MKIASIIKRHMDNETFPILYNANEAGDTSTPETWLEVTNLPEESEISVVGYVLKESSGIPMKVADVAGLDTSDGITKDGIYMVLSGGLERLELITSASCDLVVKQVV